MMKFGIAQNMPIGKDSLPAPMSSTVEGILPPMLQSGMSMTNKASKKNRTGGAGQLAIKLVGQTSIGVPGDATSNAGSASGASRTEKVVTNFLQDLTSTEGGSGVNEVCNTSSCVRIFLLGFFHHYPF